jgi:V-type H+-transporting ATPase subunit E
MVQFIRQHGREEVARITTSASDLYTIQKNEHMSDGKLKISDQAEENFKKQEVLLKIAKSKEQNERRIERMKAVNVYIDKLRKDTRATVQNQFSEDVDGYKELLKDLLLQGLIKLFEANVLIRCREQDKEIIEEI